MQNTSATLHAYRLDNDTKDSLRSALLTCIGDTETDAADLISGLREDFAPEELFGKETTTGAMVIQCYPKKYQTTDGIPYAPYPENPRITWGLVRQMYDSPAERERCYQQLRGKAKGHEEEDILQEGHGGSEPAGLSTKARITTAVTSKFKQDGDKFEGKLGYSLYDAMAAYLKLRNGLGLNQEQKRD